MRTAPIPPELTTGPFTLADARRAGLAPADLRITAYRRLIRGVYIDARLALTPEHLLKSVSFNLPARAAFSGRTAAYLFGLDVDGLKPIEVIVDPRERISARCGARLYRAPLPESDVRSRRGFRATRPSRTIADLSRRLPLVEAVVIADQALYGRRVTLDELRARAAVHAGRYGVKRFRKVLELVEPKTESPMETRLRLLLIQAGLPRPVAQHEIHDQNGDFVARTDFAYPEKRLAIEYDGGLHRDRMTEDNRRQNRLVRLGWRVLRFTAADVLHNPDAVVQAVRAALSENTDL